MALETVQLDSLNWQQMVDAIRTRIIADSSGKWTLHAPVDPGVTLLELFAWMLDQRIYWMDTVPSDLVQGILTLLGQSQQPAEAAGTVMKFDSSGNIAEVSKGTAVQLEEDTNPGDTSPPIIFSTDNNVVVLPLSGEPRVRVAGSDRTNDLAQRRAVALLAAGATSGEIEITFNSSAPVKGAGVASSFFPVMFDLATPEDVPAQWTAEAVSDVPPPASLTWFFPSASKGTLVPFPAGAVEDGTSGLRRSGIVRFPISEDWAPKATADPAIFSYAIHLSIENASYTVVPRLLRVVPNVAIAHHRWRQTKQISAADWLPLPGNSISLQANPDDPVQLFPPLENAIQFSVPERDGKSYPWNAAPTLAFSGPADRVFLVDRQRSLITFGDGLTGRLPVFDPERTQTEVEYKVGAGTVGNVGQGLSWKELTPNPGDAFKISNIVPGEGGKEAETLDAAQQRCRTFLKQRNRAVSKDDCENLAQTTPGVGFRRAYAAIGYHPLFPCLDMPGVVTVFVVPYAPREKTDGDLAKDFFVAAPMPDAGALQSARARMNTARLIGSEIFVDAPVYRSVQLGLDIAVDLPLPAEARRQVSESLQTFLDPLVGGDDGNGWPFGDPLRPSSLMRIAQAVLANAGDVLRVAVSLDDSDSAEDCLDVKVRPHELVKLDGVNLRFQQRAPQAGGLR